MTRIIVNKAYNRKLLQLIVFVHVILVFLIIVTCTTLLNVVDDISEDADKIVADDYYKSGSDDDDAKPVQLIHSDVVKRVTVPLARLGAMDTINRHVIYFNRVPQSGAEMLVLLLQKLQGRNNFKHVRLKRSKKRVLTRMEEEELVENVYDVIKKRAVPLCFDQQVQFVNFSTFDKQSPTYINLIRDPIDSFYSRHFKRRGSDIASLHSLRKCVENDDSICARAEDLTIPYFCGHDTRCMSSLNDEWPLQRAKENVEKYYKVVGVLEEMNATLEVFENRMDYFFKGVQSLYHKDLLHQHLNRLRLKPNVNDAMNRLLKRKLKIEYDFYEWIRSRLFQQLTMIYADHNGH